MNSISQSMQPKIFLSKTQITLISNYFTATIKYLSLLFEKHLFRINCIRFVRRTIYIYIYIDDNLMKLLRSNSFFSIFTQEMNLLFQTNIFSLQQTFTYKQNDANVIQSLNSLGQFQLHLLSLNCSLFISFQVIYVQSRKVSWFIDIYD